MRTKDLREEVTNLMEDHDAMTMRGGYNDKCCHIDSILSIIERERKEAYAKGQAEAHLPDHCRGWPAIDAAEEINENPNPSGLPQTKI